MKVDHILYVVSDFGHAVEKFKTRYGLAAYEGGAHANWGTGNWIVPLGESYIEILGVIDDEEATRHPIGRWVQQEMVEGDHLAGWSLTTEDLQSISNRLGTGVIAGQRTLPDGSVIRGRMSGLLSMLRGATSLPFFITWDTPEGFPGRATVDHSIRPLGVSSVTVGGSQTRIDRWVGDGSVSISAVGGGEGIRSATIRTEDGDLLID